MLSIKQRIKNVLIKYRLIRSYTQYKYNGIVSY